MVDGLILDMQFEDGPIDELLAMVADLATPEKNPLGATLINREAWSEAHPALVDWYRHGMSILCPRAPEGGKIMTFAVVTPPSSDEWAVGYPHNHGYAFHTLCTYLDPGGAEADLWIMGDDEPTVVAPRRGLTVAFPANLEHGVRGSENEHRRIALIMHTMPDNVVVH